jgi:DNA polymerase
MYDIGLARPHDLGAFRDAARGLVAAGVPPRTIIWHDGDEQGLFTTPYLPAGDPLNVPAGFVRLAEDVICHSDPERLALLYELLWRLTHGERALLKVAADPLVHRLLKMQKAVGREIHKMHAFVRFRRVDADQGERFVAWFEPVHFVLERAAPFFADRFSLMRWSILTPIGSAHWDEGELVFAAPVPREDAPKADDLEDWWRTYYRTTFNPARANPEMMRAEMPKRYWRNLPEATLIPTLLSEAQARTATMLDALPTIPRKVFRAPPRGELELGPSSDLAGLAKQAAGCERCPLFAAATQTVFGSGPEHARIVLVGEQPGDQEDLAGAPFVGPAGKLLDRALAEAGVDRSMVYVTNAVKHFKFEPRGKKRIHKKPDRPEIEACKFWLDRELALLKPELVVALGGSAAQALIGRSIKVLSERGRVIDDKRGFRVLLTIHPSMILRIPEIDAKEKAFADFVQDLKTAA